VPCPSADEFFRNSDAVLKAAAKKRQGEYLLLSFHFYQALHLFPLLTHHFFAIPPN
jgi:hypothetical protein